MTELQPYPADPGYKETTTAREAAESIAPTAPKLRERVLSKLKTAGAMTPDECAAAMELDILSVRPRFSELARLGLIKKTGERRPNRSGSAANVWRAAPQQQ